MLNNLQINPAPSGGVLEPRWKNLFKPIHPRSRLRGIPVYVRSPACRAAAQAWRTGRLGRRGIKIIRVSFFFIIFCAVLSSQQPFLLAEWTPLEKATDEVGGGKNIDADDSLMPPPVCVQRTGRSAQTLRERSSLTEFTEKILAAVNGEAITQTDIDEILTPIYLQYKNSYKDEELTKKMETARKDIINQMIIDKIILQEAKKQEVKVEEKEVEKMISEIKSNFPSEDDFLNALNNQKMSLNTLKNRYRDQLLIRKTVEKEVVSKIIISPTEMAEYYDKNKEEFRAPEEIHLKDILIKTTTSNEEEVKKKAAEIYEQLKKGAEFAEMVEKYSEDANVVDAGDMGLQKRDSLHKDIEEAVSKLKTGEFSKPVKTATGYYIFKVEEKIESSILPLEKVQEQVKMDIHDSKLKQKLDEWIEKLKKSSLIEVKTNEEKS